MGKGIPGSEGSVHQGLGYETCNWLENIAIVLSGDVASNEQRGRKDICCRNVVRVVRYM